jgi:DNA-binding transcriptional LysR family regulator
MNHNLEYFLIVAEEHSVTKAAQKVYISPQSMSSHIKRLEKQMGVELFSRKPFFILSGEGQKLYDALKKIQFLENGIREELRDSSKGETGTIKMGIDLTRGRALMQKVYPQFHRKYPNVTIEMTNDYTPNLIPMVLRGDLHFFLGTYWQDNDELETILLKNESYRYVVSDKMIRDHFGTDWKRYKKRFMNGIDLKEVADIPLIMPHRPSFMYQQIMKLMDANHIKPRIIFQANAYYLNMELAASGYAACFCPEMLTEILLKGINPINLQANDLLAYPILNFNEKHMIKLAYYKGGYLPKCTRNFISEIIDVFSST